LAYSLAFSREEAIRHLEKMCYFHNIEGFAIFNERLEKKLEKYLAKKIEKDFTPKISLEVYKNWEVYDYLLKIPKGEVVSYSKISRDLGISTRKVINALKHNPFLIIIPCHRVIRKDKRISGYTPLGEHFKKKLLELEGVRIYE